MSNYAMSSWGQKPPAHAQRWPADPDTAEPSSAVAATLYSMSPVSPRYQHVRSISSGGFCARAIPSSTDTAGHKLLCGHVGFAFGTHLTADVEIAAPPMVIQLRRQARWCMLHQ